MLDEKLIIKLNEVYESSSEAEKNIFAETVEKIMSEIENAGDFTNLVDNKSLKEQGIINPFIEQPIDPDIIFYGYDKENKSYNIRLSTSFVFLDSVEESFIDPKKVGQGELISINKPYLLEANSTILGMSVENFDVPEKYNIVFSQLKIYTAYGCFIHTDNIDSGYTGRILLNISNLNKNKSVLIYPGEGILTAKVYKDGQTIDLVAKQ